MISIIYVNFLNLLQIKKNKILNSDFDTLWKDLWKEYDINKFKKEYLQSKRKFDKLKMVLITIFSNLFYFSNIFIIFSFNTNKFSINIR